MKRICLLMILLSLLSSQAQAATWYVTTTGSDTNPGTQEQPFKTIGKGVATAANGDTIQVAAGTYSENITWNKNLSLQGAGPGLSIIDGGGLGACLTVAYVPGSTSIAGFTIQNGMSPNLFHGGGLVNRQSDVTVTNCAFNNNRARGGNGGAIYNQAGTGSITNCTFTNNRADLEGGAIYNRNFSSTITNCTFTGNLAVGSGGAILNCVVNASYSFAPTLTNCTFINNRGADGAGIFNEHCSPTLINCTFSGNLAFAGNSTFPNYGGGGVYNNSSATTFLTCLFTGNNGNRGGGVYNQNSLATFTNCTFADNTARNGSNGGGAMVNLSSTATVINSILWGDTGGEIFNDSASSATATYTNVQGGYPGTGNIDADPLFVNPAGGDYHLQATSPCLNTGSAAAPYLRATDLEGAPRILGSAPDMGVYETWLPSHGWFVDKALGDDTTGNGSPTAPFKTVVRAITAASNGHSLYIRQGDYGTDRPRITRSLRLFNWGHTGLSRIGQP